MSKAIFITVFLLYPLIAWTTPAERYATAVDLKQNQEAVQRLEAELALQKHILQVSTDNNDKRLADFGALATMQGSQTTWVGNLVAASSILITIIVALAGLGVYFSATKRAKHQVSEWFTENASQLQLQIDTLAQQVASASAGIAKQVDQVADNALAAQTQIHAAISVIRPPSNEQTADKSMKESDFAAKEIVEQASVDLEAKPENAFSAHDYLMRGADRFAAGKYAVALEAFDSALKIAQNLPVSQSAVLKLARGVTLGALKRYDEELETYAELGMLYRDSKDPELEAVAASAFVNRATRLKQLHRNDEADAVADGIIALHSSATDDHLREQVALAMQVKVRTARARGDFVESVQICDTIQDRFGTDAGDAMTQVLAGCKYYKAVALTELQDIDGAIAIADKLIHQYSNDDKFRQFVLLGKYCKAVAYGRVGDISKQMRQYRQLISELRGRTDAISRQHLADALDGVGYCFILKAKRRWKYVAERTSLLQQAAPYLQESNEMQVGSPSAINASNFGYFHFLLGNLQEAEKWTQLCFDLGKEEALHLQKLPVSMQRLEPQDSEYAAFLDIAWARHNNKSA